jgi:polyisoprenoid-binding protein YceI
MKPPGRKTAQTLIKFLRMKKILIIPVIATVTLFLAYTTINKVQWSLDKPHAKLGFTIRHLGISDVEGWFKTFDAKVTASGDDFSDAVAEMTADVNSINTESEMRDNHLKGPDFFDVAKYPTLTFKSKTFKKVNDTTYNVSGDLTMRGITKTINLNAVCRFGVNPANNKTVAGFKITGFINRSDFNIGTSMASNLLGNQVYVIANAEFIMN